MLSLLYYGATTLFGAENSEVLPAGSVAVAVIVCPSTTLCSGVKVKVPVLPLALVVTLLLPYVFLAFVVV